MTWVRECGRGCASACCARPRPRARAVARVPRSRLSGPESVGRFGPVVTYGGRTEGHPCTYLLETCSDIDVNAWLYAAKHYNSLASKLREGMVTIWKKDVTQWPDEGQAAEEKYKAANKTLHGNMGWSDGAKVQTLIEVQRSLKEVLETWSVLIENEVPAIEVPIDDYDPAADPSVKLPEWIPSLPSFGDIFLPIAVVGGVVLVIMMGGRR